MKDIKETPQEPTVKSWDDLNKLAGLSDNKQGAVVAMYANLFGVPFWGFHVLQGKPYINSLGLEWKLAQHPEAIKIEESGISAYYMSDQKMAVASFIGTDANGNKITSVGTASDSNMNSLVKGYPNELAETRGRNRILRRALLPYIYQDFYDNVIRIGKEAEDFIATGRVTDAVSVSAEEINNDSDPLFEKPKNILTNSEMAAIKTYLQQMTEAKTADQLISVAKTVKDDKILSDIQRTKLRETYQKRSTSLAKL